MAKKKREGFFSSPAGMALVMVVLLPLILYGAVCAIEGKLIAPAELDAGQWVTFTGGLLAYGGTCFLGVLTIWQNVSLRKMNEKLLDIELWKNKPIFQVFIQLQDYSINTMTYDISIKNIGMTAVRGGEITGFIVANFEDIQRKNSIVLADKTFGGIAAGECQVQCLQTPVKKETRDNQTLFALLNFSYRDLAGNLETEELYFYIGPGAVVVTQKIYPISLGELKKRIVL